MIFLERAKYYSTRNVRRRSCVIPSVAAGQSNSLSTQQKIPLVRACTHTDRSVREVAARGIYPKSKRSTPSKFGN
ncbi:hypothetical protein M413DRAFT_110648 [Hebeloma cylindrosporum]|uniref:Uncharacterized protein n=1 Tax=Hebeloma cylindrosporum TaxID=76867 RepID=A0A0C2YIE8_HEBCY|nr:hypothetical protein M413DRAFT_110648 [Hebeloma cylindrosporum h7]